MGRPDYIICLECESEVEDFTWREGAIQRASCEVCGNTDPDAFSLPEDVAQEFDDEEVDEEGLEEDKEEDEEDDGYVDDLKDEDEEEEGER
jgi:ferredoxin